MSINSIRTYIDNTLPSGNSIAMSVLRSTLKAIITDYYSIISSEENFTTLLKNKLDNIAANAQVNPSSHAIEFITGLQEALDNKATLNNITQAFQAIVNNAPENLNTLSELAAAIGNDPNFSSNVYNAIEPQLPPTLVAFEAIIDQVTYTVAEGNFKDDGLWLVQVGSYLLNSTTGVTAFEHGGITIDFQTGTITFNTPLQGGTQVLIKYNKN
jgi:hypothetical protein